VVALAITHRGIGDWLSVALGCGCRLRLQLQFPDHGKDRPRSLDADVVQTEEMLVRHPAEVAEAVVAGGGQGLPHDRIEVEVMLGQFRRVVELDVHPRGPLWTPWAGEFAESLLLPRQEADVVILAHSGQQRGVQGVAGTKDLAARGRVNGRNGVRDQAVGNARIEFT
jgi:hypothetical protein